MTTLVRNCPVCGSPVNFALKRCGKCGVALDDKEAYEETVSLEQHSAAQAKGRRFAWSWFGAALLVFAALRVPPLVLLGRSVRADLIAGSASWLLAGLLFGYMTVVRRLREPALAAAVVALGVLFYVGRDGKVGEILLLFYLPASVAGVGLGVAGSWLGAKLQRRTP